MIRGIIFDFDGLILETEGPVYQSWQEVFQEHNCRLELSAWAKILGSAQGAYDPFDDLERQLGHPVERKRLEATRRARELELIAQEMVLPGVRDYLEKAQENGLKLAIASSSDRRWVVGHLERLGLLSYFDCIRTADDVEQTKPDPELYRQALECLGLTPEEAIVFEDSPHGITAAREAGLFCIAVPNGISRQLSVDHADLHLESMADQNLEELLDHIEGMRDKRSQNLPEGKTE